MNAAMLQAGFAAACLAGAPPALADGAVGDPVRGEQLYDSRCTACHSLDANRVGPMHRGVVGRAAGGVDGFAYSPALAESDVVWTTGALDAWLTNPTAFIPGVRMGFRVIDAQDRADLIAYLASVSEVPVSDGEEGDCPPGGD